MKRIISTLLMVLTMLIVTSARECHYCKGTGKIVKNISVARYGLDKEIKVRCNECGIMYLPSSGHTHIHCMHCRGTGKLPDYGNSSESSSSISSGYADDTYYDGPSVLDLDYNVMMAEAQMHVKTKYYGLALGQEERSLMNRLSPDALSND